MQFFMKIFLISNVMALSLFSAESRSKLSDFIDLVSKDGDKFSIPKKIGRQSITIDAYFDMHPDAPEFGMDIPGQLLGLFVVILWKVHISSTLHNLQGRTLFDNVLRELEKYIADSIDYSIPADAAKQLTDALHLRYLSVQAAQLQQQFPLGLCIALFNAAAKYGFTFLFQLMGRQIMKFMIAEPYLVDYIKSKMKPEEFWKEELARWFYLLTGKNIEGINEGDYGFSIRELSDYQRIPDQKAAYILKLDNLRINSLDGIDHIVDLYGMYETFDQLKVEVIELNHNFLKVIPANAFISFRNLRKLALNNNEIVIIEPDAFPENLKSLDLSRNDFNVLTNSYTFPEGLTYLNLMQNFKLKHIAPDVIPTSVKHLILNQNKLQNYQFLQVLNSLVVLNVSYNNLTFLDPRLLSQTLKQLILYGNKLSPENIQAIEKLLPNVTVFM